MSLESSLRERGRTVSALAAETGIPAQQIYTAMHRGELTPVCKAGRLYEFSDEQADDLKAAARLVTLGIGLYLALRAVRNGWQPPEALART